MAELEKEGPKNTGTTTSPTANGTYKQSVEAPATKYKAYKSSNFLSINVPNNWVELPDSGDGSVYFSPTGAYGKDGITHGSLLGMFSPSNKNLATAHDEYVNGLLSGNSYLKKSGSAYNSNMAGRSGLATRLTGTSPVTGRTEVVTINSVMVSNGSMFYFIGVSPESESTVYNRAFSTMRSSLQINDK
jgi:hypothetical protein